MDNHQQISVNIYIYVYIIYRHTYISSEFQKHMPTKISYSLQHAQTLLLRASQVVLVVKNMPAKAGVRDVDSIPTLGKSLGEGNGNSLQYFCLGNPCTGSLEGYSPQDLKELDMIEASQHTCSFQNIFDNSYFMIHFQNILFYSHNS